MALTIPQVLSKDPVFNRYQILLIQALQPVSSSNIAVSIPVTVAGSQDIQLLAASNPNVIQLGPILTGPLKGWLLTRVKGQATIWDSQDSNPSTSQNAQSNNQNTLLLNTSADVVINLSVF
jgi:hypothetical protein